jgi:hypothetical protein
MRRVVASSLLLAVLTTLGLVCPCPPAAASPVAGDHACCAREGLRAATSCCLAQADAPKPAALDAALAFTAPQAVAALMTPAVVLTVPAVVRSPLLTPSPPTILRI